jgi:hypothetical protein
MTDLSSYSAHSPFTIRLELLKLAQSIESDRIWSERNRLEQDWNAKQNATVKKSIHPIPYPEQPVVTYEDVIRVANELNKFVSNKS